MHLQPREEKAAQEAKEAKEERKPRKPRTPRQPMELRRPGKPMKPRKHRRYHVLTVCRDSFPSLTGLQCEQICESLLIQSTCTTCCAF